MFGSFITFLRFLMLLFPFLALWRGMRLTTLVGFLLLGLLKRQDLASKLYVCFQVLRYIRMSFPSPQLLLHQILSQATVFLPHQKARLGALSSNHQSPLNRYLSRLVLAIFQYGPSLEGKRSDIVLLVPLTYPFLIIFFLGSIIGMPPRPQGLEKWINNKRSSFF